MTYETYSRFLDLEEAQAQAAAKELDARETPEAYAARGGMSWEAWMSS